MWAREAHHVWIRVWANSVVDVCTPTGARGTGSDCSTRRRVDGDDVVDRETRRCREDARGFCARPWVTRRTAREGRARCGGRAREWMGMTTGTRRMGENARARARNRARTRDRVGVEGRGIRVRYRPRGERVSGETYESPVGSPGRFPDGERAEGRARRTRRARRGRANGHEWRRQRGRKTTLESARGDDARVREATRETMVTAAAAAALDRLPRDCLLKVCEFLDTTGVEALARTCRAMREATMDDCLWKGLYESRWRWRPAQTWAKSAKLPFESNFRNETERPDAYRGGEGWRAVYKERYATRQMKRNSTSKRVVRVVSASDEKSMQARARCREC